VPDTELFGTATCAFTREMREWLEWSGREFVEHDVDVDREARRRLRALVGSVHTVPVLLEDGQIVQVGWQGRGCIVNLELEP
jgi:glutaredoxin